MSNFTSSTPSNTRSRKRGREEEAEFAHKRGADQNHRVGRELQPGRVDERRDTTVFKDQPVAARLSSNYTTSTQNSPRTPPNILAQAKSHANLPTQGPGVDIALTTPSNISHGSAPSDNDSGEVVDGQTHHHPSALQPPLRRSVSGPYGTQNPPSTHLVSAPPSKLPQAQHDWLQQARPYLLHYRQQGKSNAIPGIPFTLVSSINNRHQAIPLLPWEVWGLRSLSSGKRHYEYHSLASWGLSMLQIGPTHPLYPEFWELIVERSDTLICAEMQWLGYHLGRAPGTQQDRHAQFNTFRQQQAHVVRVDALEGIDALLTKLSASRPPGEALYLARLRQTAAPSIPVRSVVEVPPQTNYLIYREVSEERALAGFSELQTTCGSDGFGSDASTTPPENPTYSPILTPEELLEKSRLEKEKTRLQEEKKARYEAIHQNYRQTYESRKEEIDKWWNKNHASRHPKTPHLWLRMADWEKYMTLSKPIVEKPSRKIQRKAPATAAGTPAVPPPPAEDTGSTPEKAEPVYRDCGTQQRKDPKTWIRHGVNEHETDPKLARYICNHKLDDATCNAEQCIHKCCKEGLSYAAKQRAMSKKKYVGTGPYDKKEAAAAKKAQKVAEAEAERREPQTPPEPQSPTVEEIAAIHQAEQQRMEIALEEHNRSRAIAWETETKKQYPNKELFNKWWDLTRQSLQYPGCLSTEDNWFLRDRRGEPSKRNDWNWNWKANQEAKEKAEAEAAAAAAAQEKADAEEAAILAEFYEDEDDRIDEELFGGEPDETDSHNDEELSGPGS